MTIIEEVRVLLTTSEIQVKFVTDGNIHYEVYNFDQKERFINQVEDPENGGAQGFSAPYLTAVGW